MCSIASRRVVLTRHKAPGDVPPTSCVLRTRHASPITHFPKGALRVACETARGRVRDTYLPTHPVFNASLPAAQAQPTQPSRSLCMKHRQLRPRPQCGSQVLVKQPSTPSSGHTLHQAQPRVSTTIPLRACRQPYAACNSRTTYAIPFHTPCFRVLLNTPS